MNNKFVNDDFQRKSPVFKNYFWAGTAAVVLLCALLYLFGGNHWNPVKYEKRPWTDGFYVAPLIYGFLNCFGHSNLQHMLLNMLCFAVAGVYLERKIGTLRLLFLVAAFAFLSTGIIAANSGGVNFIGYSGVNYAFYFYIVVDFIFTLFRTKKDKKPNLISGAVVLCLIYFAMCFSGGTMKISFKWYPYDLFNNMGHAGGAIAGTIVGLIASIWSCAADRKSGTSEA